jgi:D-alanyl-D-alanine carboxypeptidase
MNKDKALEKFTSYLEKLCKSNEIFSVVSLIHSEKHGIHWKRSVGILPERNFHIASVGKTINAAIAGMLVEQGKLSFEDTIDKYLDSSILDGLHVYKGKDYSKDIQISHLLGHTAGFEDYFEKKGKNGERILDMAVKEKDKFWTPDESLDWAKSNLDPIAAPGKKFKYSDTGYQLLGLILQNITDKPLWQLQKDMIFDPLEMDRSYMFFHSKPKSDLSQPLSKIFVNKTEVSTYRSLSLDWGGGGVVSTVEDLLKFHKSLMNYKLIKRDTLEKMLIPNGRISQGMNYGMGLWDISFNKIFFLLPKVRVIGSSGSTGSYMYYNREEDVYFIGTFNHEKFRAKHIRALINFYSFFKKGIS